MEYKKGHLNSIETVDLYIVLTNKLTHLKLQSPHPLQKNKNQKCSGKKSIFNIEDLALSQNNISFFFLKHPLEKQRVNLVISSYLEDIIHNPVLILYYFFLL